MLCCPTVLTFYVIFDSAILPLMIQSIFGMAAMPFLRNCLLLNQFILKSAKGHYYFASFPMPYFNPPASEASRGVH